MLNRKRLEIRESLIVPTLENIRQPSPANPKDTSSPGVFQRSRGSLSSNRAKQKSDGQDFLGERIKQSFLGAMSKDYFGAEEFFGRLQEMKKDLNGMIGNMDGKIEKILQHHETEYVRAFKYYIKETQQELQQLRSKTNEIELKYMRDDKILQLENAVDDGRSELAKSYLSHAQTLKIFSEAKREIERLEKEKQYLEATIKSSGKDCYTLKREYEELLIENRELKRINESLGKLTSSHKDKAFSRSRGKHASEIETQFNSMMTTNTQDAIFRVTRTPQSKNAVRWEHAEDAPNQRSTSLSTHENLPLSLELKSSAIAVQKNSVDSIVDQFIKVHKDPQRLKNEITALVKSAENEHKTAGDGNVNESFKARLTRERKEKIEAQRASC